MLELTIFNRMLSAFRLIFLLRLYDMVAKPWICWTPGGPLTLLGNTGEIYLFLGDDSNRRKSLCPHLLCVPHRAVRATKRKRSAIARFNTCTCSGVAPVDPLPTAPSGHQNS